MSNQVVIIDYGAGNIQSVQFALERLGVRGTLSRDPETIASAGHVIFPGVGEAGNAMEKLKESGLHKLIPELKQPVLGICLGMQLMCSFSEEGKTKGLGIFTEEVKRFPDKLKVPQIGWNSIDQLRGSLFEGIEPGTFIYLVHSYYVPLGPDTAAVADYGFNYSAALARDNFMGVQFHPEKSSSAGAQILQNFLKR